ncbi:MAG: Uma2 family endonuclease [Gammaproteobacteria bacterium]|nr:Uma2 family endonuclease [Gammaproteobacteria bacterium]
MSTVLDAPEQSTRKVPAVQKVILYDISWETYERLLAEHGAHAGTRFSYDCGALEIMSPLIIHERINRRLATIFETIAEERGVDFDSVGSSTFRREDLKKGFEPDSCFYITHLERVREKAQINLRIDPPPDLIIEVDITSPSLPRFPIFAAVGVPEVWRYDGARVRVFALSTGEYVEPSESASLPGVTGDVLTDFLAKSKMIKRAPWLHGIREWARHTLSK